MTNLLRASLIKYFNSRRFFIALMCSLVLGLIQGINVIDFICNNVNFTVSGVWLVSPIEDQIWIVFDVLIVISLVMLELGRDNADGAIRNKLAVGCTRKAVCASELISALAVTVCIFIAFIIPTVLCGWEFFSGLPAHAFVKLIGDILLFFLVWSIIGTALTLLCSNRTMVLTVIVSLALILSIAHGLLKPYYYNTDPPETTMTFFIDDSDGVTHEEERTYKNKYYIEGLPKTLVNVEHEINPFSRLYNICNYAHLNHPERAENEVQLRISYTPERQLMYDCLIMILTGAVLSVGAVFAFERKDLK